MGERVKKEDKESYIITKISCKPFNIIQRREYKVGGIR